MQEAVMKKMLNEFLKFYVITTMSKTGFDVK